MGIKSRIDWPQFIIKKQDCLTVLEGLAPKYYIYFFKLDTVTAFVVCFFPENWPDKLCVFGITFHGTFIRSMVFKTILGNTNIY